MATGICGSEVDVETRAYWGLPRKGDPFHFQHNSEKCLILAGFLRLSQSEKIAGRQDHTTSPSAPRAFVFAHDSRPPHPAPNVRDDREAPLLSGAGRGESIKLFLPARETNYFCKEDWTTQISLKGFTNLAFWSTPPPCRSCASRNPSPPANVMKKKAVVYSATRKASAYGSPLARGRRVSAHVPQLLTSLARDQLSPVLRLVVL